jgi:outer membrane receptor protein involved in Fe transport
MGVDNANCIPGLTFKNAPCVNLNKKVADSGQTHKVNLEYRVDDQRMVYFTYSTGYRPGGVNRNGDLPPYMADTLSNYEVGWKTRWFDRTLTWNGAVFYENWDKFQFSFLGLNSLTVIQNGPSAKVYGVETSADWLPTPDLVISGSAAYIDAKSDKFCGADASGAFIQSCADADAVILGGAEMPYTPKFKGNVTVRYTFPILSWDGHVQATGTYQSKSQAGLRQADIPLLGEMPGYGTMDLAIGAEKNKLSVELFAKNLTDSRGQLNRYTPCTLSVCGAVFPGVPRGLYVVPIQPRLIGLRFGQRF